MITVALINENRFVLEGMKSILLAHLPDVTVLTSIGAKMLIDSYSTAAIQVIVLGISQTNVFLNLRSLDYLAKQYSTSRIMLYDPEPGYHSAKRYFQAGIRGYLTGENSFDVFLDCINSLLEHKIFMSPELFEMILPGSNSVRQVQDRSVKLLTRKELDLAKLLCQGKKTSEIANLLNRRISTVSTVKKNVFRKLQVNSVVELTLFIDNKGETAADVESLPLDAASKAI